MGSYNGEARRKLEDWRGFSIEARVASILTLWLFDPLTLGKKIWHLSGKRLIFTNPLLVYQLLQELFTEATRSSWNIFVRPFIPRQKSKLHLKPYKINPGSWQTSYTTINLCIKHRRISPQSFRTAKATKSWFRLCHFRSQPYLVRLVLLFNWNLTADENFFLK